MPEGCKVVAHDVTMRAHNIVTALHTVSALQQCYDTTVKAL